MHATATLDALSARSVFVGLAMCAVVSSGSATPTITVLVQYESNALHVLRSPLASPLHHVGFYIEWTNERKFLSRHRLVERTQFEVNASILRTEVRRFADGWGERSGKYCST